MTKAKTQRSKKVNLTRAELNKIRKLIKKHKATKKGKRKSRKTKQDPDNLGGYKQSHYMGPGSSHTVPGQPQPLGGATILQSPTLNTEIANQQLIALERRNANPALTDNSTDLLNPQLRLLTNELKETKLRQDELFGRQNELYGGQNELYGGQNRTFKALNEQREWLGDQKSDFENEINRIHNRFDNNLELDDDDEDETNDAFDSGQKFSNAQNIAQKAEHKISEVLLSGDGGAVQTEGSDAFEISGNNKPVVELGTVPNPTQSSSSEQRPVTRYDMPINRSIPLLTWDRWNKFNIDPNKLVYDDEDNENELEPTEHKPIILEPPTEEKPKNDEELSKKQRESLRKQEITKEFVKLYPHEVDPITTKRSTQYMQNYIDKYDEVVKLRNRYIELDGQDEKIIKSSDQRAIKNAIRKMEIK